MFQMTFAVITPALIIGAYAERIRFGAVLMFSALWLIFVYAPVAHWVWGGGWLAVRGVMDFAGGIVVHVTAGVSALTIAWMLGPREGFPRSIHPPHAPWMVMIGASLLWVGWFGFNAGSALASGGDAGMTMLATHLSAATATLTWISIERVGFGQAEPRRRRHRLDRRPGRDHAGVRLCRTAGGDRAGLHRGARLLRGGAHRQTSVAGR